MGVKGLQFYLEKCCKSTSPTVNIEDLALSRSSSNPNQELIIVVDGSCCVRRLYGDLEWIGGAQLKQYEEKAKYFVQRFKSLGVRLIFFFDGPTVERKRKIWVERRLSRLDSTYKVLDAIDNNKPTHHVSKKYFELPPALGQLARVILKTDCGCEVYQSLTECDEEIADYARTHNVFGILGQDTDYVIMDTGNTLYLSMEHLDLRNMTTRLYDRWELARNLKIHPSQLPMLATFMGNDIVAAQDLRTFHLKVTRQPIHHTIINFKVLVPGIANFVRSLPRDETQLDKMLPDIAMRTLGDRNRDRDIVTSLRSYQSSRRGESFTERAHSEGGLRPTGQPAPGYLHGRDGVLVGRRGLWRGGERRQLGLRPSPHYGVPQRSWRRRRRRRSVQQSHAFHQVWSGDEREERGTNDLWSTLVAEARRKHHIDELPNMVYAILSDLPFESSTSLEDFRKNDLPTFASATQQIRQRTYGILLQEKPLSESGVHLVPEWCMAGPGSLDQAKYVPAVPPASPHPGLLELWSERKELLPVRWHLFVSSVSANPDVSRVKTLPSYLVIPTLILFNLNEFGHLESWEVDAMLATASCVKYYDVARLAALPSDPVSTRGIRVANLIMRFTFILYILLAACGYPLTEKETAPLLFFDGKLFQMKYNEADAGYSHKGLCDEREDVLKDFQEARDVVFNNKVN